MTRNLIKILVGLAVALGLTLTSAPDVQAAPAADGLAVRAAAPDCSAKEAALAKSRAKHGQFVRAVHHARNDLRKAKRAEHRAKTRKAKRAKHKVVVREHKQLRRAKAREQKQKRFVRAHQVQVNSCRNSSTPATSPIQTLCDAGIPQDVCDALADVVTPGADPVTTTIAQLCAAAPTEAAPLCDLFSGIGEVPLDPATLTDVLTTVLTTLGLGDLLSQLGLDSLIDQDVVTSLLNELGLGSLL
jgi:hypothetical protein